MTSHRHPLPSNRRTGAFERRVARALAPLLEDGEPVVVATSGGPDSTTTLVAAVRALGAARVTAAHFDHRLRPNEEIEAERAFLVALTERLGVPLIAGRASKRPGDASEQAAREARYRWLARALGEAGARACVTGHTLDDQAETVLLRLTRGTGAGGAAGMAVASPWPVNVRGGAGLQLLRLLRPLLQVSRAEVEEYLAALGLVAMLDPSNATADYARNQVRQDVIPALRRVNARAVEHLARFAAYQREDDEALAALAGDWLQEHVARGRGQIEIDRRALRELHRARPAVARRAIRLAGQGLGVSLDSSHVEAILDSARQSRKRLSLPLATSETCGMILRLRLQTSA